MAERHKLGGRTFVAVRESTVEQDYTFLSLVAEAGISELTMEPEEAPDVFTRRILDATVRNGAVLKLLGCLLIPEEMIPKRSRFAIGRKAEPGEAWTPELSEQTAAFLGRLTSPKDKAKIRELVLSLLLSFFESGIVSLWTTATSYDETIPDDASESPEEESPSSRPETSSLESPVSAVGAGSS